MKQFTPLVVKLLVTLLIGSGVLATNLHAQDDAITVSVPFTFTVGSESLPPGTYRFSLVSSQFLLSVRNVKSGDMEMFTVNPQGQRAVEQHGVLVFDNSEGRRALNEIHFPGTNIFSALTRRRARRMEAKRSSTTDSVSVAQR